MRSGHMKQSPFKFLDPYEKKDRDIFFGREKEIELLYENTFKTNLLLIYGQSGTGKTSLIQCGLANRFRESDWFDIYIRRGDNINTSLRREIAHKAETPIETGATVADGIQSLYLDFLKPIYLIFDQFEELFILGSDPERREFFDTIKQLLTTLGRDGHKGGIPGIGPRGGVPCKILFMMREEFIARLYDFEKVVPQLFNQRFRVEPMPLSEVEAVIGCSCDAFEIGLVEREQTVKGIVESNRDEQGMICLPYLQVYLDRLYREAEKHRALEDEKSGILFTPDGVAGIGKISDVMAAFLDEQTQGVQKELEKKYPDAPEECVWQVLNCFVTVEGTNLPLEKEVLYGRLQVKEDIVNDCLSGLERSRILRLSENQKAYEIAHDALALRIDDKRSVEEKTLLKVERLVKERFIANKDTAVFLAKGELNYIEPYEKKLQSRLEKEEIDFIAKSRKHAAKRKRDLIIFTVGIICILLVLLIFAGWQWKIAEEKTIEAIASKENAEKKEEEAKASKIIAEEQKEKAEQKATEAKFNLEYAEKQKTIAEKNEAAAQKAKEEKEKNRIEAVKNANEANKQKEDAQYNRLKAEQSTNEAIFREALAKAKELAAHSIIQNGDKDLKTLLAITAYFIDENAYRTLKESSSKNLISNTTELINKYKCPPEIFAALRSAYIANNEQNNYYQQADSGALASLHDKIIYTDRDGKLILTSLQQSAGNIKLPNFNTVEELKLPGNIPIDALFFAENADRLYCGTKEGNIFYWEKNNWSKAEKLDSGFKEGILSMAYSRRLNFMVYSISNSVYIKALNRVEDPIPIFSLEKGNHIRALIIIEEGNNSFLIFGDENGDIFYCDITGRSFEKQKVKLKYEKEIAKAPLASVAYNPKEKLLVFGDMNGEILLLPNLDCRKLKANVEIKCFIFEKQHKGAVKTLVFDTQGRYLASGGLDGIIMLWDTKNEAERIESQKIASQFSNLTIDNKSKIQSLIFTRNGEYLIYSDEKNLKICPTNPSVFYEILCKTKKRDFKEEEWQKYIGDLKKMSDFKICVSKKEK